MMPLWKPSRVAKFLLIVLFCNLLSGILASGRPPWNRSDNSEPTIFVNLYDVPLDVCFNPGNPLVHYLLAAAVLHV